jgi:NB-ARC domain
VVGADEHRARGVLRAGMPDAAKWPAARPSFPAPAQRSGTAPPFPAAASAPSVAAEAAPGLGATPTPYRCLAPRPHAWVARGEYRSILEHLLAAAADRDARAVGITTALRGASGLGKTTLAQALCHDPEVQAAYPGGILWLTLGDRLTDGERLSRVRDLLRLWCRGEPPAFETLDAAGGFLRELLAGRRVLVAVDDVWSPLDLSLFVDLEPGLASAGLSLQKAQGRAECTFQHAERVGSPGASASTLSTISRLRGNDNQPRTRAASLSWDGSRRRRSSSWPKRVSDVAVGACGSSTSHQTPPGNRWPCRAAKRWARWLLGSRPARPGIPRLSRSAPCSGRSTSPLTGAGLAEEVL